MRTVTFKGQIKMLHRILCALSAAVMLTAQQPAAPSRAAELLLGKARSLEARGRIDLAAQAWQQLLMIEPDQQDAIAGLARAAKMRGNDAEAAALLEKLRKANPVNPVIKQVEAMGKSGKRNPELDEAGRLAQGGQTEKSVAAYRKAFGGNAPPSDWALPYYETLASTPGGWEQATAAIEEHLKKNPAAQDYKLALGRLYTYRPAARMKGLALLEQASGAYAQQAQQPWKQALAWENGSARAAESTRRYLGRYPDPELEAALKKSAAATGANVITGEDLRQAYNALKADDVAVAEKLFNAAVEKNPKQAGALAGLGFVRMKQQDFPAALKNFELAVKLAPENKVFRDAVKEARFWESMQKGDAALKDKRSDEAVDLFKKAYAARPSDPSVMEGYAGALMQRAEYAAAVPVLERLIKADSTQANNWLNLIGAKQRASGWQAALETVNKVPPGVAAKLSALVEYNVTLAGIYQQAGKMAEARKTLTQASVLAGKSKAELPAYVQLQLGGLYSQFGETQKAAKLYRSIIERQPDNLDAWEGYLLASNRARSAVDALQKLQSLPVSVHEAAQARPSFLRAVATLEAAVGNLSSAESLLNQVVTVETVKGEESSFSTQLQLAQLWLEQGKNAQAASKFAALSDAYPENRETWKGLILAHQKAGAFEDASEAIYRIPAATAAALDLDADYVASVAALYKETRTGEDATKFLQTAMARYTAEGRSVPPVLTAQLGWLLLNKPGSERDLFVLLRNARARTDFSAEQRKSLDEIWAAWFLQSADRAAKNEDPQRAVGVLESGVRMLPSDLKLQRALGTALLTNGDSRRAVLAFKAAGLQGATSSEYLAAIGASAAAKETRLADQWLKDGLTKFPTDNELLTLAGKQAAAKGDFKKAEAFWRLALQGIDLQSHERLADSLRSGPAGISDLKTGNATDDAGTILLSASRMYGAESTEQTAKPAHRLPWSSPIPELETAPVASDSAKPVLNELIASATPSLTPVVGREAAPKTPGSKKEEIDRMLNALQTQAGRTNLKQSLDEEMKPQPQQTVNALPKPGVTRVEDLLPAEIPTSVAMLLEPRASDPQAPERDKMLDRIRAIEGRNSPYVGLGGGVQSRNGQAGFERMTLQESTLESSNLLLGKLRATVVAKSVFADSASPDGQSLLRFGMLPQGDTFQGPSVNGFGAEVQLSGNNFGMRFGSTPRGFPIRNVIAGFRFRPAGGPITLSFDRDSVKDTILSYAGAQDPMSRRVWGGVIANTGNASGNWGDEKSGVYFNLGFHHITGESVQTNRRIDGTMGTYWRLAKTSAGSLNAGVNLFAMHYAKNLRFFTVGHGGYFSPQRFLLFNVPVSWSGKAKRLEYTMGTSIGSQSFTEEASAYFPLDPAVQGKAGPFYPKLSSSGVNYNIDFRTAYQVSENWFLLGYMNVNNARFYSMQSAGISIKYSFSPRPLNTDFSVPSIPDWRGRQPFGIQ